jgi:hypothetical protein
LNFINSPILKLSTCCDARCNGIKGWTIQKESCILIMKKTLCALLYISLAQAGA